MKYFFKNSIKWVRNSNVGKGWVSWQMLTGENQVPQECKIMDTSQKLKLYEVQVCFVLYRGCIMGTLCFNGPRPESLPPPCAPARHGKFKNSFISIIHPPLCLDLDHFCSSSGNLIPPFTVSLFLHNWLLSSPLRISEIFPEYKSIFYQVSHFPKQILGRRKSFWFIEFL